MTFQIDVDVSKMFFFRIFRPIITRYNQNKIRGNLRTLKVVLER